jgi:hypothetical protein
MRRITDAAKWLAVSLLPYSLLQTVIRNQERMMMLMSENQDKINALTTKVEKIVTEIEALKAQPGAEDLDFSALEAAVNTADDLNPDAEQPPSETVEDGSGQDELTETV